MSWRTFTTKNNPLYYRAPLQPKPAPRISELRSILDSCGDDANIEQFLRKWLSMQEAVKALNEVSKSYMFDVEEIGEGLADVKNAEAKLNAEIESLNKIQAIIKTKGGV